MKLGYVIQYVPDVTATVRFYEAAFDLKQRFMDESGNYAELETGGTALAFAQADFVAAQGMDFRLTRPDAAPPGVEIGLTTADVQPAFERALAAGATAVMPPTRKPWGQMVCYVRDLNGQLVEICTPMG